MMSYAPKSNILKMQFQKTSLHKRNKNIKSFFKKLVALGFLIGAIFVILPSNIEKEINDLIDPLRRKFDIGLKEIIIEGNSKVRNDQILKASKLEKGDNIFALNLQQIKDQVEKDPWVEYAIVERILPHTIRIIIEEEKAKAVYINKSNMYLINSNGDIIERIQDNNVINNYIYLIGEGANLDYSEALSDIYSSEEVHNNIEGLIKVQGRRWDIKLKNSSIIKLPETNIRGALDILDKILKQNNFLSKVSVVDLRLLPDKIYIKY